MEFPIKKRQSRLRRGLSFVEFVGCLVSMIGGVLLGSVYLGLDMQQITVGVLEQAQVVAPGYFNQVVAVAASERATPVGDQAALEAQQSTSPSTDATTPAQPTSTATSAKDSVTSTTFAKPEPSAEERIAATRAYWDQLTSVMLAEARGRLSGAGSPEEWELYDYLSQRKRGHEEALAQFGKLEQSGVDDRLLDHGDQVIAWHKDGIKLFDNALSLLSDGPGAKLTGPFAQSWQSAATQLRMEESLVVDRHRAVANYLDREYANAGPFVPAFQQQ